MVGFFAEIRVNVLDFEIKAAAFIVVFQFLNFAEDDLDCAVNAY